MLYHIICDLIPFNVIVWYNSYFHMLYHIIHNVIPLCLTVYNKTVTSEEYIEIEEASNTFISKI